MGRTRREMAELRTRAEGLFGSGRANTDIARELGLPESTVRVWRGQAAQAPALEPPRVRRPMPALTPMAGPPPLPAALPVEPEGDPVPLDLADLEGTFERFIRSAESNASAAARDGNHTAAQRGMRDAANMAMALARLTRERRKGEEQLVVTREELEATQRTLRDRVHALLEKPLVCARCSREIAIEWGRTVKEDIPA
jgi:hypothetical protein